MREILGYALYIIAVLICIVGMAIECGLADHLKEK